MALDRMLIDGTWCDASDGATIDVIDPATEERVGTVPSASAADLDRALDSARRGFAHWREVDAWTRSATLRRVGALLVERTDAIAATMTAETGKPLAQSHAEVLATADQFDWYADEARRSYGRTIDGHTRDTRLMVLAQPVGPVAAFTAWNFPALLPARKIAPALAAGCSIIVKPAEESPRTMLAVAEACVAAGVPAGVLNVVTGDPAMISHHLLVSDVIRKVSLTGSVPVGRTLLHLAADRILPVSMELGGHAPVLVFADADLDAAAELCVQAKFRNCGQVCISPTRFFVHDSIAAAFTERFVAATNALAVGDPTDPRTDVGPLANARRRETVEGLLVDARDRGATVATGGRRCDPLGTGRGFFFEPTVLTEVAPEMQVMQQEPFGPVAPLTTFTDLDDGLRQANATTYGLAGYVFTRDLRTAHLAGEGLDVGMVGVNHFAIATAEAPFGGVRQSGFGREGGSEGIDSYTVTKYLNIRL
jgi:succinate-semialdehyde dehydrogenase/glutarate-semialdehyde dehydrogenase